MLPVTSLIPSHKSVACAQSEKLAAGGSGAEGQGEGKVQGDGGQGGGAPAGVGPGSEGALEGKGKEAGHAQASSLPLQAVRVGELVTVTYREGDPR